MAVGSDICDSCDFLKTLSIPSMEKRLPSLPMFLNKRPIGVLKFAKGPVLTIPNPFPKYLCVQSIDCVGFVISKSILESQYGIGTSKADSKLKCINIVLIVIIIMKT
jgi:hypothetical protein